MCCRRSSRKTVEANSFLLCMASPVLHKMICGSFREGRTQRLSLEDVDGKAFEEILKMWCGKGGRAEHLEDVLVMASVADRLEMLDVYAALEAFIIGELRPEVCAEVLMSSRRLGLGQVEAAAWGKAVRRFDEVCRTAGFMGLDEETVGKLLEEDGLGMMKEEEVFEGLVGWMKGDASGGLRGRELLGSIRFGVMEDGYLEEKAREMLPEEHREWVEGLVGEALRAKEAARQKATVELGQLGAKALTRRRGRSVEWERYSEVAGGRELKGHEGCVRAIVECEGRMCSGSLDGSIRVWRVNTLEEERVLLSEGDESDADEQVYALAVWEGQLISGHESGSVRVWDVGAGELERELAAHFGSVLSLCVVGLRLASGSDDDLIKVWTMGAGPEWPCERTLKGHTDAVASLAVWEGKLISGSDDNSVCVWELETGGRDATLTGHRRGVCALLVHMERLFSVSVDGSVYIRAVGTWAVVACMEPCGVGPSGSTPLCLAASGTKFISGSWGNSPATVHEVQVWDVASLKCEHTVRQPAGAGVRCLAAAGGEVWGGVGWEVVVWGRD